jgi:hydroxypyruvate isomerase
MLSATEETSAGRLHIMPRFAANLSFMFQEVPFLDRFEAAAKAGFSAVEFLFPYENEPAEIAARLKANGLTQALFNLPPGDWTKGERGLAAIPGREAEFEAAVATALRYADATGCRRIHAMPGLRHHGADRRTYVANLKRAARLAAKDNVDVIIEPINTRDIPGFFLNTTGEARAVIHEVAEPNLGLQFDLYHRQIQEGDTAMAIREFGHLARHYQIASPPDRGEPDDGEMNYAFLFREIDATGFSGYVGCEYKPRRGTLEGLGWVAACGVTLG